MVENLAEYRVSTSNGETSIADAVISSGDKFFGRIGVGSCYWEQSFLDNVVTKEKWDDTYWTAAFGVVYRDKWKGRVG
jgi:hypothetical protein